MYSYYTLEFLYHDFLQKCQVAIPEYFKMIQFKCLVFITIYILVIKILTIFIIE